MAVPEPTRRHIDCQQGGAERAPTDQSSRDAQEVYFVAESADRSAFTSFTVASGQPSAFQRSGMIARVAFPSIRRSPSKSDVNQFFPCAFKVPACPGPINGPLVVARNRLPPLCSMSTPALSRYGPLTDLLRPMRML